MNMGPGLTHVDEAAAVEECSQVRPWQGQERVKLRQQGDHLYVGQRWPDDDGAQGMSDKTGEEKTRNIIIEMKTISSHFHGKIKISFIDAKK